MHGKDTPVLTGNVANNSVLGMRQHTLLSAVLMSECVQWPTVVAYILQIGSSCKIPADHGNS